MAIVELNTVIGSDGKCDATAIRGQPTGQNGTIDDDGEGNNGEGSEDEECVVRL